MTETEDQRLRRKEAALLGEIGAVLLRIDLGEIEVRLPRDLAQSAVEAWKRGEGEGPLGPETFEMYIMRSRAAELAWIGSVIEDRGRWDGDEVVVPLDPHVIGAATEAAPPDSTDDLG